MRRRSLRLAALACLLARCGSLSLLRGRAPAPPRAPLGTGGSVTFPADNCSVLYDGAGAPLSVSSPCARCTAPWLRAEDAATGAAVCRCMAACLPAASRTAAVAAAAARAAAAAAHGSPGGNWSAAWDAQARAARGVQLVIGLGTGRCGTVTLAQLLKAQPGCSATFSHEQHPVLPWSPQGGERAALRLADGRVRLLLQRRLRWSGDDAVSVVTPLVGDVASFYLPYVPLILALEPGAVFLVLRRERADVVRSFLRKDPGVDLWRACANRTAWSGNHVYWAAAHPKYPCDGPGGVSSAEEALGRYWDDYDQQVAALQRRFPDRVRVLASPEVFADAQAQEDALAWAGFGAPRPLPQLPRHNCGASCTDADAAVKARGRARKRARKRARRRLQAG